MEHNIYDVTKVLHSCGCIIWYGTKKNGRLVERDRERGKAEKNAIAT